MARDPETLAHLEWLGYVQPVGLVVSIPALLAGGAHVNRNITPDQQRFLSILPRDKQGEVVPEIRDFPEFACTVLGWDKADLIPTDQLESLVVPLPEYGESLRPTFAVKEFKPKDPRRPWLLLVQVLPAGTAFDALSEGDGRHWQATPHHKFERLLRESEVPIGVLCNGSQLRVAYAPRGETSGYLTFTVSEMTSVAGRPIFAALHMLLNAERLFSLPEKERLPALLTESRKYQNVVSTQLAGQVMAALFELLRGIQAADDQRKGELLRQVLAQDPNQVYSGLLTVLMRLVFILYAEDRGLLSSDPIYANYYSVTGLFERLRADAGRYPDTMDQRYGSWAQFLTLFRLIYEGGQHAGFQIPARKGYLFDPDRYPFLEGRSGDAAPDVPRVADGCIFRVLSNLLVLDGERLSYRTLDVEQIGSVYEAIMGFNLEVAQGQSIAIKPKKTQGAPATINLEELLAAKPGDRDKWLKERTDQQVTGKALDTFKKAGTQAELLAALEKKIAREVTPNVVPKGAMIFQPSDERRRSGSHYTPRSLTEPIVRKTLEPVLKQLGDNPTPKQLLDLKVCDPAMGSGAFLVEVCRQLGDVLVKAWHLHKMVPRIPPDEDEILHARRLIAQRCLYGVDKNPMAVDLAKLSLWLATLAKDHPFTFLDHALRHGDSLVGLTRKQIAEFHWLPTAQRSFGQEVIEQRITAASKVRQEIIEAGDTVPFLLKQQKLAVADESLNLVRFAGNLVIAAFFAEDDDKKRKSRRDELLMQFSEFLRTGNIALRPTKTERQLVTGEKAVQPFHWETEFPEVFSREKGGFDAIVGNPPFLGGTLIGGQLGLGYHDYLVEAYRPATGLADVIAFFFRRAFELLRCDGALGLIATNTIAQGDTRSVGLGTIIRDAVIYDCTRRFEWPGEAAVVASIVHIGRTQKSMNAILLDGRPVGRISSFLLKGKVDELPLPLAENKGICYRGAEPWGAGFLFEEEPSGGSSSITEMRAILDTDPRCGEVIFPYMGGKEFNTSPTQSPNRFIIDFARMPEIEARRWPQLFSILESRVRPVRAGNKQRNYREEWWLHANRAPEAAAYSHLHGRLLALGSVSSHLSIAFAIPGVVLANSMHLILLHEDEAFAVVQSRIHETWARFLGSSMKDDLRYSTPCFDTFPRPVASAGPELNGIGKEYYESRALLMRMHDDGLTQFYNRFHDPNESSPDIKRLRELHTTMDRAVLDAYGWTDLQPTCEFLLDYEDDDDDDGEGESGGGRRRKKPWRYRWPDEFRDEVLARLLELNKQRAEQEQLGGTAGEPKPTKPARGKKKNEQKTGDLFK